MHRALKRETETELPKLHHANKEAIEAVDKEIEDRIGWIPSDATFETLQVNYILAMMQKRQFILSIPNQRAEIKPNETTKEKILKECHEEHRGALLNVFEKYEGVRVDQTGFEQEDRIGRVDIIARRQVQHCQCIVRLR